MALECSLSLNHIEQKSKQPDYCALTRSCWHRWVHSERQWGLVNAWAAEADDVKWTEEKLLILRFVQCWRAGRCGHSPGPKDALSTVHIVQEAGKLAWRILTKIVRAEEVGDDS